MAPATDPAVATASVLQQIADRSKPALLPGIARHWPLVTASLSSAQAAAELLLDRYNEEPVTIFRGHEKAAGRIFYTADLSAMNFQRSRESLRAVLHELHSADSKATRAALYMGSTALDYCLPGLREQHELPIGEGDPSVRIWLGNETLVAPHYDVLDNIACVCAGRRRFTLYPPQQLPELYPGPLEFTPAGQPVSLVDTKSPDAERFPHFGKAAAAALEFELGPGDAIYIPGMWWHQVEGLEPFNVLINHWWRDAPDYLGIPGDALLHAILAIRDLPERQRDAWRVFFDHYVFGDQDDVWAHIPENRRGVLGPLDPDTARRLRVMLRERLNR